MLTKQQSFVTTVWRIAPQVLQKIVILDRSYSSAAPHRVSLSSMSENEDELRTDQDNDLTECVSAVIKFCLEDVFCTKNQGLH